MRFKFRDIFFLLTWANMIYVMWKGGVKDRLEEVAEADPLLREFWHEIQRGIDRIER